MKNTHFKLFVVGLSMSLASNFYAEGDVVA